MRFPCSPLDQRFFFCECSHHEPGPARGFSLLKKDESAAVKVDEKRRKYRRDVSNSVTSHSSPRKASNQKPPFGCQKPGIRPIGWMNLTNKQTNRDDVNLKNLHSHLYYITPPPNLGRAELCQITEETRISWLPSLQISFPV